MHTNTLNTYKLNNYSNTKQLSTYRLKLSILQLRGQLSENEEKVRGCVQIYIYIYIYTLHIYIHVLYICILLIN